MGDISLKLEIFFSVYHLIIESVGLGGSTLIGNYHTEIQVLKKVSVTYTGFPQWGGE